VTDPALTGFSRRLPGCLVLRRSFHVLVLLAALALFIAAVVRGVRNDKDRFYRF
jgi:hypothetical protein